MAQTTSCSLKPTNRRRWPKPSSYCPAPFPPQASTLDKGHGRVEDRALWSAPTNPAEMGLAGATQVIRLRRHTDYLRQGSVVKQSTEVVFALTSLTPEEASAQSLLQIARDHWSIENGQHHRRDRTQDEDRCMVRETVAARNLSLFRSLAIFLFKQQSKKNSGKKSLPDFQARTHSHPWALIHYFTDQQQG